jgi:4-aminobutyrate aminotransferase
MGHCERPSTLGYTPLGVSTVHSSYASAVPGRNRSATKRIEVDSVSSGSSRIAGDRPVPDIVTEIPGPKARAHVAFDEAWTSPSLPRAYPIVPVRGEGLTVEDIDGNLFLDFAAGIAVNSTGHSHPKVVAAIQEQAAELIHFSASDFYLPIYPQVCREMARIAPIAGRARAYLGNSGTEAVEAAIKLARFATKRPYVVAFLGAFHGRTYGSVSLTASKAKYHAGFGPLLPGIFHAPYGRVEDLRWFDEVLFERLAPANEVAAIIVEPIQGEGGYIVPEDGFLQGLRRICDEHGILLIADEIQSGAGRTGKMWAVEHWDVQPDILLTAKGIASGMTLGAMIARADLLEAWGPGAHGSTYGGNPVACAAALATIELLEDGLVENARVRGEQAFDGLALLQLRHRDLITDVRGKGLMIGIEFDTSEHAEAVQWEAFQKGLLVLECGKSSIRMAPPLTVTEAEMATALRLFAESVAAVAELDLAIEAEALEAGALHEVEAAG